MLSFFILFGCEADDEAAGKAPSHAPRSVSTVFLSLVVASVVAVVVVVVVADSRLVFFFLVFLIFFCFSHGAPIRDAEIEGRRWKKK